MRAIESMLGLKPDRPNFLLFQGLGCRQNCCQKSFLTMGRTQEHSRRWCMNPTAAKTAPTQRLHDPIANEAGRPSSVMRFKMLHASAASVSWAIGCRARSRSLMIDLYLKKAFSTRACRW